MNIIVWPVITFTFSCMRFSFIRSTEVLKNFITSFGNTVMSNASKTGVRNGKSTRGGKIKKSWWKCKIYLEWLHLFWHSVQERSLRFQPRCIPSVIMLRFQTIGWKRASQCMFPTDQWSQRHLLSPFTC